MPLIKIRTTRRKPVQVETVTSLLDMLNFRYVENSSRYVEETDGNKNLQFVREIIIVKIFYSARINKVSGCLKSTYNTHSQSG